MLYLKCWKLLGWKTVYRELVYRNKKRINKYGNIEADKVDGRLRKIIKGCQVMNWTIIVSVLSIGAEYVMDFMRSVIKNCQHTATFTRSRTRTPLGLIQGLFACPPEERK